MTALKKQLHQLENKNRKQKAEIHRLNAKYLELSKKVKKKVEREQKASGYKINEKELYSKALEAFESQSSDLLRRVTKILAKAFPQSIYADNAVFLNADLAFRMKMWEEVKSWSYYMQLHFPYSNKLGATLLLEAKALQQMNEKVQALQIFEHVQKQFPGSREAQQAQSELLREKEIEI